MTFIETLLECLFVWHLKETGTENADVIIAHAGAENKYGKPGRINQHLETVVRKIHHTTRLPIVAQGELAQCLRDLPLAGRIPKQSENSTYLDTVDVTKIHKAVCEEHGWKHPILVSYEPHLWRAEKVCRKLGMHVLVAPAKEVYDKDCSQWWMRSPWLNYPRELLCRILWLLQGKI